MLSYADSKIIYESASQKDQYTKGLKHIKTICFSETEDSPLFTLKRWKNPVSHSNKYNTKLRYRFHVGN
jgi:hypothetical protein